MQRRQHTKTDLNKLQGEWHAIGQDGKPCAKGVYTKETEKNLITLDIIERVR